jgi:hypothetical protein
MWRYLDQIPLESRRAGDVRWPAIRQRPFAYPLKHGCMKAY